MTWPPALIRPLAVNGKERRSLVESCCRLYQAACHRTLTEVRQVVLRSAAGPIRGCVR